MSGCDGPLPGGWNHPSLQGQEHCISHWVREAKNCFASVINCYLVTTEDVVEPTFRVHQLTLVLAMVQQ